MRSRASLAIGAGPPWAMSKKRRRRWAQQKASVIASSGTRVGNGLVGRIAVALHDAAIVVEQLQRVDRAATRRIGVGDGRRVRPAPGPVVAGDRPEVAFLGAAAAGIEHRRRGLVDRDLARGQNELAQPKPERLELRGRIADPERQDRALDRRCLARAASGLADRAADARRIWRPARRRPSPRSAARP